MNETKILKRLDSDNLNFIKELLEEEKCYIQGSYILESLLDVHWNRPIEICGIDINMERIEAFLLRQKYRKVFCFINHFDKVIINSSVIDKYNLIEPEYLENFNDNIETDRIFGYEYKNPNNIDIIVKNYDDIYEMENTTLNIENIYYDGKNIIDKENVLESIQTKICYIKNIDSIALELKTVFFYTSKKFFVDFTKVYSILKNFEEHEINNYNISFGRFITKLSKVYSSEVFSGVLVPYFHSQFRDNVIFGYNININNNLPKRIKQMAKYNVFSVKRLNNNTYISYLKKEITNKSVLEILSKKYSEDIVEHIGTFLDRGREEKDSVEDIIDRRYMSGWL